MSDGWHRDLDVERQLMERSVGGDAVYCFACEETTRRAAALLFLKQKGPELFSVTNIIPTQCGQLSPIQYNTILQEFYRHFVFPAANEFRVHVEMTPSQQGLKAWLSQEAVEKLKTFSRLADRNAVLTRVDDRDRWCSFLVKAHEEESRLDPAMLKRWFENQFWSADIAGDLAVEYERVENSSRSPTPTARFIPSDADHRRCLLRHLAEPCAGPDDRHLQLG